VAGAMTNYLENELLDHVLRAAPYTPPSTIYIGLFTSAPGEAAGGTEVSGGAYQRQAAAFAAASNGQTQNTADITFPIATADWGTITHVALFDAQTGGNMLFYASLTAQKQIQSGDQMVIKLGNLAVTLD
jgi:hypothetical protein